MSGQYIVTSIGIFSRYFLCLFIQFFFHPIFNFNSYLLNYEEGTVTKTQKGKCWLKTQTDEKSGLINAKVPATDADIHESLGIWRSEDTFWFG